MKPSVSRHGPGVLSLALATALSLPAAVDPYPIYSEHRIKFPDVPGYHTLKCDFHIHTVFSDGKVWPSLRVEEALRDGLDAIAITDHLEWLPHQADLPLPNYNRSSEIAQQAAKGQSILIVPGAEITRNMPPGHLNAIFLQDANALKQNDPLAALREAAKQRAFVIWNHPDWLRQAADGEARLTEMHEQMLKENLFQGIEVVNDHTYSDEALQIALDRNLAIIGDSDIHGPIAWEYQAADNRHRPVTLVFAKVKTESSLKEALLDRRTVVWWKNTLIGRKQWLDPLLAASLSATTTGYLPDKANLNYLPETSVIEIDLKNTSDADFILRNASRYRLHNQTDVLTVAAHSSVRIQVKTLQRLPLISIQFEVLNAVTAPGVHPVIAFAVTSGMK